MTSDELQSLVDLLRNIEAQEGLASLYLKGEVAVLANDGNPLGLVSFNGLSEHSLVTVAPS